MKGKAERKPGPSNK